MKKTILVLFSSVALVATLKPSAAETPSKVTPPSDDAAASSKKVDLTAKEDVLSYTIGYQIGAGLKNQPFKVKETLFFQGIQDAASGKESMVTQEKAQEVINAYKEELTTKHETEMKALATSNAAKASAFLEENKKKKGIVTLPTGLQYQVLTNGKGPNPKPTDTVTTHYRGNLIDGTEFDSSYARKEPVSLLVNGVIPGWTEALQKMKVGSKWKLFIPPNLGYGERGMGRAIPPNSLLIFEVELLNIGTSKKK